MELQQYEIEHNARVRRMGPECMVLLKSNGAFPVAVSEPIALYGSGARHTLKGGTGGGIVEVRTFTNVEQGLENAGFVITTKGWLDAYDQILEQAKEAHRAMVKNSLATEGMTGLGALSVGMKQPAYELPLNGDGETAVYVLTRVSGEGADRTAVEGDIFLTQTEIRDILALNKKYPKFMLVLNVSGVVDLTPVAEQVENILLLSQTGNAVGDGLADVLCGRAYPSGKLASTWAAWKDYSTIGNFGDRTDTYYREGIYVGYRYFDAAKKEPLFAFGFGLGYTTFSMDAHTPVMNKAKVTFPVTVKNTGNFAGKEVVQIYVSLPQGKRDQSYQVLAAFEKSKELLPGESQLLNISFDMESLAVFDDESCCRILPIGNYILRVGNSSRNTCTVGVISLDKTAIIEQLSHVGGSPEFADWKPKIAREELTNTVPVLHLLSADVTPHHTLKPEIDADALAFVKTLSDKDLAYLCTGGFAYEDAMTLPKRHTKDTAGAVGVTTYRFETQGVPSLNFADGPAGLHISGQYGIDEKGMYPVVSEETKEVKRMLPEHILKYLLKKFPDADNEGRGGTIYPQYCTAIPIATALAQSWNPHLCEECGDLVACEMERFNIHVWLAPALNIHRNPLCGRNFEYFSEDPLLSGKMGAGIVRGINKHPQCASCLKHFVCNEQEFNRLFNNSHVSERALRDIYMRAFEIVVKEAMPAAIMSSYNLLNGEHTAQRFDLMETVLRQEWGFTGMVMSDWVGDSESGAGQKYARECASGVIAAGNDLMMPGGKGHYEDILAALNNTQAAYPLTREAMERCAARNVMLAWRWK